MTEPISENFLQDIEKDLKRISNETLCFRVYRFINCAETRLSACVKEIRRLQSQVDGLQEKLRHNPEAQEVYTDASK